MKKYQIVEVEGFHQHAGTKATADFSTVADRHGYKKIYIKMKTTEDNKIAKIQRQIGYFFDWNDAYKIIDDNSILLLQHPFHNKQLTREIILKKLKQKKHVKVISVIHDIEELRKFRYNNYYAHEFDVMHEIADIVICHNEVMKSYLIDKGFDSSKIVILGIFDYLQNNHILNPSFSRSLTIAGNLDVTKCRYISELSNLKSINIELYGPNFDKSLEKNSNIHYNGSFPPNDIPNHLDRGFGLVWDGCSIDGCKGDSGQYLKYNNPHKLSLYLSSGLPVVIWNEAAEAKFVKDNKVGICVDSLYDLDQFIGSFSESDYIEMKNNVLELSKKLQIGFYATRAINEAEHILNS